MQTSNNNLSAIEVLDSVGAAHIDALYAHIPFCFHKCHYCDFYSIVDNKNRQEEFTDSLISELTLAAQKLELKPQTIFFGGGTPTLLDSALWEKLLEAMKNLQVLDGVTEFTVEANPETVDENLVRVLVDGGVNRMSIGAQSFDKNLLKTLERWHEPQSVYRAAEIARANGINNINLDLIFAVPGETDRQLEKDLDCLIKLHPQHLSCYSLIFEPGTPLTKKKQLGRIAPMAQSKEAQMYEYVIARLRSEGFEHYEVSNWARPGKQCAHNLVYWNGKNYLGIGPSASSFISGRRWRNKPNLGSYIAKAPAAQIMDFEKLDEQKRIGEALMLKLRLLKGAKEDWLKSVLSETDQRRKTINEFEKQGLLERKEGYLRVTPRGLMVADGIAMQLL